MGSKQGVLKAAARRIGISLEEYLDKCGQGLKWCTKGKHWQAVSDFYVDASRGDGLKSVCWHCDYIPSRVGPSKRQRRAKRKDKLAWCRGCLDWLPLENVHGGACQRCHNREARERYARDEDFRNSRRQRSSAYRRGVDPVPPEGQEVLIEDFMGQCAYCGKLADSWDHIVAVKHGGETNPGNIVPACTSCNSSKKHKDVVDWLGKNGHRGHPSLYDRMALALCALEY